MRSERAFVFAAVLLLGACSGTERASESAPNGSQASKAEPLPTSAPSASPSADAAAFDAIGADETISFVGTEPFWGGTIEAGRLTYSTPENQAGENIAVRRFAGNNGLGFTGTLGGEPFDMTITPGTCSDGMSDRSYPFTATLKIGAEQRNGCAWTARQGFSGPENP